MKFLRFAVAMMVVVLGLFIAGCGGSSSNSSGSSSASSSGNATEAANVTEGPDSGTKLKFAVVTHSDESEWWIAFKKGMYKAADQMGVDIEWSPAGGDPQKQAQLIEAAVASKVDGIAVTAPNPDAIKGPLKVAEEAGIPVVVVNSGSEQFKELGGIAGVGQGETIAGEEAGERFNSSGAKDVLCIIHEQGNIALNQRCEGVKNTFTGEVTNLQVKGLTDAATTETEIESKLEADHSVDQIITLNPEVAEMAKTAIKAAGSSAKLATFDLSPEVLEDVESGEIEFAIDQQSYLQGYLPIVFLDLYVENANIVGGGLPVLTGPGFIDKSNAARVLELSEKYHTR